MLDWNNPKTLGSAITKAGMTTREFADVVGISRSQLYRLMAGSFKPRFDTEQRIRRALTKKKRAA